MTTNHPLLEEQDVAPGPEDSPPHDPLGSWSRFSASDTALYEQLGPELIRFAATLVGPSAAEDLFATAILGAFVSPRWAVVSDRRSYLYRCVVNHAHKQRRATVRRLAREGRVAEASTSDLGPAGIDPTVLGALRQLTIRQRAVIYLTYWCDLSQKQVAETLESSLRTVERDLTTARSRLEELLS